jgi:hypothetical protein
MHLHSHHTHITLSHSTLSQQQRYGDVPPEKKRSGGAASGDGDDGDDYDDDDDVRGEDVVTDDELETGRQVPVSSKVRTDLRIDDQDHDGDGDGDGDDDDDDDEDDHDDDDDEDDDVTVVNSGSAVLAGLPHLGSASALPVPTRGSYADLPVELAQAVRQSQAAAKYSDVPAELRAVRGGGALHKSPPPLLQYSTPPAELLAPRPKSMSEYGAAPLELAPASDEPPKTLSRQKMLQRTTHTKNLPVPAREATMPVGMPGNLGVPSSAVAATPVRSGSFSAPSTKPEAASAVGVVGKALKKVQKAAKGKKSADDPPPVARASLGASILRRASEKIADLGSISGNSSSGSSVSGSGGGGGGGGSAVVAAPATAEDRHRLFVSLIKASKVSELSKAFTEEQIRAAHAHKHTSDRDIPIIVAMEAVELSPTPEAEEMFLFLLRRCPVELLCSTLPGNSWSPFYRAIQLSSENAEPFLAMTKLPNLVVETEAICHFARFYRLPDGVGEHIDFMMSHGADLKARAGSHGDTALHYACSNHSIGPLLVAALLARGADVLQVNKDGHPPLFACVVFNNVAVAQQLLEIVGVSASARNSDGKTAADLCEGLQTHAELYRLLRAAEAGDSVDSRAGDALVPDDDLVYDDIVAALNNVPDSIGDHSSSSSSKAAAAAAAAAKLKSAASVTESSSSGSKVRQQKAALCAQPSVRREPSAPLTSKDTSKLLAELDSDLSRSLFAKLNRSSVIDAARKRDVLIAHDDVAFYERLGSGTYGQVFRGTLRTTAALSHGAADASDGDATVTIPVAIKQLMKVPTGREDRRTSSFLRQFEAWASLDHPNLVFLYGVVLKPSLLLVMEQASRGSLLDALQAPDNHIDWAHALAWVADIAEGTRALHEHSPPVYHRDLKPSNVLVDDNWRLKISDFDTARLYEADNMATFDSKIVGSPAYMAVEIFTGQKFTDKSDIYSIGVTLNELAARVVTGRHHEPYSGCDIPTLQGGIGVLIYASGVKQGRPIVEPKTPKLFRALIEQCWNADATLRPSSAQLHAALLPLLNDLKMHPANWTAACDSQ